MSLSAKRKKIFLILIMAVISCGLLTLAPAALAADTKWFRLVPECATIKGEPGKPPPVPSLVCALQTFGNIAQIILGLTGSFALLMFVYGGFLMVTSAGSQEKVSQGKKVITNAVIGIIIIMTSGLLIQYGMNTLGIASDYQAIGQPCGAGKKGQYIQPPNAAELFCAEPGACDGNKMAKYKMKCVSVTGSGAGVGKYCIPNLCTGARDLMCCYLPDLAAPAP